MRLIVSRAFSSLLTSRYVFGTQMASLFLPLHSSSQLLSRRATLVTDHAHDHGHGDGHAHSHEHSHEHSHDHVHEERAEVRAGPFRLLA